MKTRNIKRILLGFSLIGFYLLNNAIIQACSSCNVKYTQAKLDSYFGTTLFLSMIPLVLGAGLSIIVYKVTRKDSTE